MEAKEAVYIFIVFVAVYCISQTEATGPRCLSCNIVQDPAHCNTTEQCGENEYCSPVGSTLIGKRQPQSARVSNCSLCCKTDRCNAAACGRSHTGAVNTYPLMTLGQENSCQDRDQDTCTAFGQLNKDACKLQHVSNLCPKSCGLCEYFGWASWGTWGPCSRTCNPGLTVRHRKCEHQLDVVAGQTCPGPDNDPQPCLNMFCSAAVKSTAAAPKNYEAGISTVSSVGETQAIRTSTAGTTTATTTAVV